MNLPLAQSKVGKRAGGRIIIYSIVRHISCKCCSGIKNWDYIPRCPTASKKFFIFFLHGEGFYYMNFFFVKKCEDR